MGLPPQYPADPRFRRVAAQWICCSFNPRVPWCPGEIRTFSLLVYAGNGGRRCFSSRKAALGIVRPNSVEVKMFQNPFRAVRFRPHTTVSAHPVLCTGKTLFFTAMLCR